MHPPRSITQYSLLLAGLLFLVFVVWYRSGEKLSKPEVERLMQVIEAQPAEVHGSLDLPAFRKFLETDDGEPFYNVNLFKFREIARYGGSEAAASHGLSGEAAFQRYSAFMLRALPARACHVVFGTTATFSSQWDLVATARYRSRRDLAELFASPEFADAVVHKWAALEDNQRVPVQARGLFATAYLPVAALLLALVFLVHLAERAVRWRRPRRRSPRASALPATQG